MSAEVLYKIILPIIFVVIGFSSYYFKFEIKNIALNLGVIEINLLPEKSSKLITADDSKKLITFNYKENLVAYFNLRNNFNDNTEKCNTIIPINNKRVNNFDNDGFLLNDRYLLSYIEKIPKNSQDRTFFFWFKPSKDFDFDKTQFLFSYGNGKEKEAFGLFYGKPEIHQTNGTRGLRVFVYCENGKSKLSDCDSEVLIGDNFIHKNTWYYTAITYDSNSNSIKVYFGQSGDSNTIETRPIHKKINTNTNNYVSIGAMIEERQFDGYCVFPLTRFNFDGYIREFMVFDKVLEKSDIEKIAGLSSKLINYKEISSQTMSTKEEVNK
jgi:hypothetical protein